MEKQREDAKKKPEDRKAPEIPPSLFIPVHDSANYAKFKSVVRVQQVS